MALFIEKTCPICGKGFIWYEQWVFHRGDLWFCSNRCTTQYDKGKRIRHNNRRLDKDERREVKKLLAEGMSVRKIAELVGISENAIYYYQNKDKIA